MNVIEQLNLNYIWKAVKESFFFFFFLPQSKVNLWTSAYIIDKSMASENIKSKAFCTGL